MSYDTTTATDRKYPATDGADLLVGDVTIDSLGNRYLIVGFIAEPDGSMWAERRDLNLEGGEWIASGRIYTVDLDSYFMVVK